jgi:uncharacterized protein
MSIEANKKVVQSYFDAINAADGDAIFAMTTDDFLFKTMARAPEWLKYEWNRAEFAAVPATMSQLMKSPIQLYVVGMIAEGDNVSAEAVTDCEMLNGRRYDNAYHFVFKLRDGKLREVLEYSCSYLAQSCFGAVEPGNPESSKMAD